MTIKKRLQIAEKFGGLCAYTGKPLGNDWQIDHVESKMWCTIFDRNADTEDNLLPVLGIVNHYKRSKNLSEFRYYMETFHLRLAKLPKITRREKTTKRKAYIQRIADAFDITPEKPFSGKFYFETINIPIDSIKY